MAGSDLRLRPARSADAQLLWRWANDPEVRRHAFHPEPIPWETHERWFSDRLRDERCLIAIGELDSVGPVGQVRFEERGDGVEIDISVNVGWRGRGIGRALLDQGLELARSRWPAGTRIVARVVTENLASTHLFETCGFARVGPDSKGGREHLVFERVL